MPWLRQLVSGLSLQRHGFSPKAAHVGFVVDIVILGQGSSKYFSFPVRSIHPYSHSIPLTSHQPYTIIATNNIIQKQ